VIPLVFRPGIIKARDPEAFMAFRCDLTTVVVKSDLRTATKRPYRRR
jgi:hypothetical protein